MDSNEVGSIQLERLSVVTLLKLRAAFLQMASEARQAEDNGAEEFLTQLAGVLETARERTVSAIFTQGGPLN